MKKVKTKEVECITCHGRGRRKVPDITGVGIEFEFCHWCSGTGKEIIIEK